MFTVSELAAKLGEDRDHLKYAIRVCGLKPARKAGTVNLYRSADVRKIKATLGALGRIVRRKPV